MLTTIGKTLAVLTTVICLAFLGVAGVVVLGGPNWAGVAQSLDEYQFTYTPGESPTWAVKNIATGENIGATSPTLPPKIVDALNNKLQGQRERLNQLDTVIPQMQSAVEQAQQQILADIRALGAYEANLRQQVAQLNQQIVQKQEELSRSALAAEQKHEEAERRRNDVYRLQNLVAQLEIDRYRAVEHQRKLRDLLARYQGVKDRLERRRDQLQQRVSPSDSRPPNAGGTTTAAADAAERS